MTTKITEEDYLEAVESYMGFCKVCKEFTRDCTEPDIYCDPDYECPECGLPKIVGAENALIMGLIDF